jgi:hypothetical protein
LGFFTADFADGRRLGFSRAEENFGRMDKMDGMKFQLPDSDASIFPLSVLVETTGF